MQIEDRLNQAPVIPLVQANEPETALLMARALADGGLSVVEVVLRTPEALECLAAVARGAEDLAVGAGTVLTPEQADQAIQAGATFIVSPGLHEGVVRAARDAGVPVYPGVVTPTELQAAWNLGLRIVKFFPASLAGGVAMLKALGSVFSEVRFIPTGGVSTANLPELLALPSVIACGGSWLTPAEAVQAGDFGRIREMAAEAVVIAQRARR